ncbi:transcription factor bHLH [Salix suchowensis]|nr:transcription factor bHLH [Salix suchowensis]
MALNKKSRVTIFFTIMFIISFALSTIQSGAATRAVHGEQWLKKHVPHLESLQRGPVPPSAGSPCSHNPGGSGHCTLNEMNFAGRSNHQPPFPSSVIDHSKASN